MDQAARTPPSSLMTVHHRLAIWWVLSLWSTNTTTGDCTIMSGIENRIPEGFPWRRDAFRSADGTWNVKGHLWRHLEARNLHERLENYSDLGNMGCLFWRLRKSAPRKAREKLVTQVSAVQKTTASVRSRPQFFCFFIGWATVKWQRL